MGSNTLDLDIIASVGAGRMGRGIAITFALAGYAVRIIDLKDRTSSEFDALCESASAEIHLTMSMLSSFGMLDESEVDSTVARVSYFASKDCKTALADADIIFEAVPETLEAKEAAFTLVSRYAQPEAIVASTTSTILSDELQPFVSNPSRFLNAHWLNPAFLIPLVEVSPAHETNPAVVKRLNDLLERIGKVPVVCTASPGYIVPRIQAIAMNEAARMVEEGVATVEDIDKATKYGFGFRFSILGLLEFIDWGGGDILYYASRYMTKAMQSDRFSSPAIIERNMNEGRIGLSTQQGFLDYSSIDVNEYQRVKLAEFVALLRHIGKLPPNATAEPSVLESVKEYVKAMGSLEISKAQSFVGSDFSATYPGGRVFTSLSECAAWSKAHYQRLEMSPEHFDQCHNEKETVVYCYGTLSGVNLDGSQFTEIRCVDRFTVIEGLIRSQQLWNDL